jgi:glutamine amidotransferase-like uncharacterized protein
MKCVMPMRAAFVEGGGAYLGLCAGAYYACSYVEFDLGSRWDGITYMQAPLGHWALKTHCDWP